MRYACFPPTKYNIINIVCKMLHCTLYVDYLTLIPRTSPAEQI